MSHIALQNLHLDGETLVVDIPYPWLMSICLLTTHSFCYFSQFSLNIPFIGEQLVKLNYFVTRCQSWRVFDKIGCGIFAKDTSLTMEPGLKKWSLHKCSRRLESHWKVINVAASSFRLRSYEKSFQSLINKGPLWYWPPVEDYEDNYDEDDQERHRGHCHNSRGDGSTCICQMIGWKDWLWHQSIW